MGSYFMDTIRHAVGRKMEQCHYSFQDLRLRDRANGNPVMVITCATVSVLLLLSALAWSRKSNSADPFETGRKIWFHDENTKQLFKTSSKHPGPIKAPSGPLPNGSPAGLRAHVYSYIRVAVSRKARFRQSSLAALRCI
ncbi:MAG: hypothetical protein GY809_00145 [Planctomycetes bacterium]|nr:hypothetical protein [Planctomycetota bacterium]